MKNNDKIALIVGTLSEGGLERVVANYSHLFEKEGYDVSIYVINSGVGYSYSGKLEELKIFQLSYIDKVNKYFHLSRQLKKERFDYILDHRVRLNPWMEFVWKYLIYRKQKVFYFVHSSFVSHYIQPKNSFFSFIFKNDLFITVSKGIEQKINRLYPKLKTKNIYNPIAINENEDIDNPYEKYVVAIARMTTDNVKQVDIMLECFAKSKLPSLGYKLMIIGDGEAKQKMMDYAKQLNIIEQTIFKGFVSNPFSYLKKAYCTLLTSKFEGFGMVLAESLLCGTPVVSYDCEFGPKEIIQHEENGLLVENQDKEKFVLALNRMVEDKKFYEKVKKNAKNSIVNFLPKNIMKEWNKLFEE